MEEWRPIEGYEYYEVSNLGRVRSWIDNRWRRRSSPKVLSPHRLTKGYLGVSLSSAPNVSKTIKVHRLVAKAFIPNPDNLPMVNHKDENKTNNCVSNLEWITPKDNCNYGTRNERQGLGHSKPIEQYDLEGNFIKEWDSAAQIERDLGFNHSNISKCCLGRYNIAYNYKWKFK